MKIFVLCVLVLTTLVSLNAYAGKPGSSTTVGAIVDFALVDGSGNPYYVRPIDGKGPLVNGVDCTTATISDSFGLNVYINQCGKNVPPSRTMEVNMASPAQGQNPISDYTTITSFHIATPSFATLTAVGQSLDIDFGLAVNVPTGRNSAINYKIRYGESGTPLAVITCTAASNNQCTQWVVTPGGGTDLAEVFDTNGNNYGWYHMPFYLTVTKQ